MHEDSSFEAICIPHRPALITLAIRLTKSPSRADDLVQETYFLALRAWPRFTSGADAKKWLKRIMRNAFYGREREDRNRHRLVAEFVTDVLGERTVGIEQVDRTRHPEFEAILIESTTPEDLLLEMEVDEQTTAIADSLDKLTPTSKEAIVRCHLRDEDYEEVAEEFGLTHNALRQRLFRARNAMRDDLGSAGAERWARGRR